jgi:hypothetical protein
MQQHRRMLPHSNGAPFLVVRRFVRSPMRPIELWLEPMGMMFRVAPGRELEVVCQGSTLGELEVERHPDGHLALYAWPGARFCVREGGQEVYAEPEIATEFPTRPGGTVREMIELMFGPFEERRLMFRQVLS